MKQKKSLIENRIPAILWGEPSTKCFIAVHGDQSNKEDIVIELFAKTATSNGYQVLSFDLPEHGERINERYPNTLHNAMNDLQAVLHYIQSQTDSIGLFGISIGAFYSLMTYPSQQFSESFFLSPIVNMLSTIEGMMYAFNIDEEELQSAKEIDTPIGKTLYWDYYYYIKHHPVTFWENSTKILYGKKDQLCSHADIVNFANQFDCQLTTMPDGEHFFHTEEQLLFFSNWLNKNFSN